MSDPLQSKRKGPETATSALVFLHGYGADGADLLGLAEPLAQVMPQTAFFAPDAPEPCVMNPVGRQWFPIPWIDGSSEAAVGASLAASSAKLNAFLDRVLADEGIDADRLVLLGFSQGTMMSLHVAPRRALPVAAIAGFSGRLLMPSALAAEAVSKPPVMLLHGDADDVVPFASMAEADTALRGAGFEVNDFVMHGVGHGISPEGLQAAVAFILPRLG
ncbi:MAG: prolyl oligopeptidase family serine peptidase [Paracoccaceae bacterium]|nr:prolyl oligopeptidase family serine peptidase [Paracoccaceae bacterium]